MTDKSNNPHPQEPVVFHASDIITAVPTCCLIEDYWILHNAMKNLDWLQDMIPESTAAQGIWGDIKDDITTTMECIQESIDRFTMVQKDLNIKPSVFSAVAMNHESGIILDRRRNDLLCAAGQPVSVAGDRHCAACPFSESNGGRCDPQNGFLVLTHDICYCASGGYTDNFVSALYERYKSLEV